MTHEELLSHQRFVRDLARRLLADDSAADDVSQDAMVAALVAPPGHGSLRAWLTTVVRNLVRRGARAGRRRDARERAAARPEAIPPDHDFLERLAWHRRVVDAVLSLDEPYRRTVVLRHYESLPPREIARLMSVPAATVRTRLYRAYALLRARLGSSDERHAGLLLLLAPAPWRRAVPGALLMSTKAKLATVVIVALALVTALYATRPSARGGAPRAEPEATRFPPRPPASAEATPAPPAAPVALARDLDVHGVVVDGSDRPVANALVETLYHPWQRARLGHVECAAETVPGPSTRTAPDGTFACRLRAGDSVMLRVSATGFATTHSPARQAGERVRIVLSRGASVSVRVVDAESGAWIEGAVATLRPGYLDRNRDRDLILERHRRTTGADGACRFDDLEAPMEARLEVDSKDHVWNDQVVSLREGETTSVDLALKRGSIVRGVVVDAEAGTPVEGAEVDGGLRGLKTVWTGRDGRFVLRGVPHKHVAACAEGYALAVVILEWNGPRRYFQWGESDPREGEEVEIRLRRGFAATGRVLSADGAPVEGALVAVTGTGGFGFMDPRAVRTDAGGGFTLGSVQPLVQPAIFVAMAPGHGRVLYRLDVPGPVDLGDIRLPLARTLSGRLLGPHGEPMPRVTVFLRGSNDDKDRLLAAAPARDIGIWWGNLEFRLTDDLGRFRFPDLAPGTYELAARPAEGPAVTRDVEVAVDTEVELTLDYAHELTVHVVDGQGLPVPGARLSVQYGRERLWGAADDRGIAVVALPAPATRVGLLAGMDWDGFLPSRPVDLPPDAREVTLTARRAAPVTGRVVDKAGAPVAGVPVTSVCAGEQLGIAVSADDGSFRAKAPLGGTTDLTAITETLAGELCGVAGGSEGIVLVVRPR